MSGCTYESDSHYVNPNIHPPPAQISATIDVEAIVGEFSLAIPTYFRVTIDRAGKSLKYFRVSRAGKNVEILSSGVPEQYLFYVDPIDLDAGIHEYEIEAQLSSGSGSLAEASGLEYYIVEKKLVVTVDKTVPSPVTGITADMVNGHMTLRWNKPAHDHYFYSITRQDDKGNYQGYTIYDADVIEYVDEGYLGGPVVYSIALQSAFFAVQSEPVAYDFNTIEAVAIVNENNHLKVSWTVLSQFGDDVFIRASGRNFTKDFPAASGEAIIDTMYLGDIAESTLKLLREGFEDDGLTIRHTSSIGTRVKAFDEYSLLQTSNKLILNKVNNGYKTYRYNATTALVEDSLNFPGIGGQLLSSQDGNHQYFVSGSYLYSFNPLDFSEYPEQIYLNSIYRPLYGSDLEFPAIWAVSNDNFLVLTNRRQIVTMDLNNKQLWGTAKSGGAAVISGDGGFMVTKDEFGADVIIYKRGLTDWEEIGKVPYGERIFFSRLPNPKLICSMNGVTKLYDLMSTVNAEGYFSEIDSAPIDATGLNIVNNWIISETVDAKFVSTISIYSIDEFEFLSVVKARVNSNWLNHSHFVVGGQQLITSGFIKEIE
jgi:hypothetical protein